MSDDAKAAKDLVETLTDGERGFAAAAEKVRGSDHPEWAATLQRLSEQRAGFRSEIVALGHSDHGVNPTVPRHLEIIERRVVAASLNGAMLPLEGAAG